MDQNDAWGSDHEQEPLPSVQHSKPVRKSLPDTSLEGFQKASVSAVPSLRNFCLRVVGSYLEEVIQAGDAVLSWLPGDIRATLFAVACRQGLVTETNLGLFLDEDWKVLDVSKTGVTWKALEEAAGKLPDLRALDLSNCTLRKRSLRVFAEKCPKVEILRLKDVNLSCWDCIEALEPVLPSVVAQSFEVESWEDKAEDTTKCGSFVNLKYVVWPGIPREVKSFIHDFTPGVVVVDSVAVHSDKNLPQCANPGLPLDKPYIDDMGPQFGGRVEDGSGTCSTNCSSSDSRFLALGSSRLVCTMSIAERFRWAYVDIDARKAAKSKRNYEQRERRGMRKSHAQLAVARWLDGD